MIHDAYALANSPNPWLKVIGGSILISIAAAAFAKGIEAIDSATSNR